MLNKKKIYIKKNLNFRENQSKNFFKFINNKNLNYAVLGNLTSFPKKIKSDLDIFIDLKNNEQIKNLISNFAKKQHLNISNIIMYEYNCVAYELTKLVDGVVYNIIIDVCNYYTQQYRDFQNLSILKKIKVKYKNTYYFKLIEKDNVYYYFSKKILKNEIDKISYNYFKRRRFFLINNPKFSNREKKLILEIFNSKNFIKLKKNFSKLEKIIKSKGKIRLFKEIKRYLFRIKFPTGLDIALLGVDGSGKTTQINFLLNGSLQKIFRGTKVFHLYNEQTISNTKKVIPYQKRYGIFLSFFKIMYLFLKYLFFNLSKISILKIKTKFILIDRNHYDVIIDPKRYGISYFKPLINILFSVFLKPDLLVFLNPNPKIIYRRSKELSKDILNKNINLYNSFLREKNGITFINANYSPLKLSLKINRIIYSHINKKTKIIFDNLK